ncbi:MAG: hypothetical protein ABEI52_06530 [Halobacteriaceae archaeon]
MAGPPETERREVMDELHGNEITDPYRWLEESTDEVEEWIEAQNEYADEFLETETSSCLRPRFEELARVTDYGS